MWSAGRFFTDPTVVFTIGVVLVPCIYCDQAGVIEYLTQPMMGCSVLMLAAVILFTNRGSARHTRLSVRDERVANWFLMNGVYFNFFLDVVSGQWQLMGEMSRQYQKVEPRYLLGLHNPSGQSVFMTSMCELCFQAPLCLLAYYAYHHQKSYRHMVEFTVCILHPAGVWWFYVPEAATGFPHLGGWPSSLEEAFSFHRLLFFWFGFFFCGILWCVVPFIIGRQTWWDVCEAMKGSKKKSLKATR